MIPFISGLQSGATQRSCAKLRGSPELVVHTSEERLIYPQICHDHGVFDHTAGYGLMDLAANEDVLKRCAYFDMAETIESGCEQIGR